MAERRRYTDHVLDEKFKALETERDLILGSFDPLNRLPSELAETLRDHERRLDKQRDEDRAAHAEQIKLVRTDIGSVGGELQTFAKEYRDDKKDAARNRAARGSAILIATIGWLVAILLELHSKGVIF